MQAEVNDIPTSISNVLSIYLIDYEKIRDEIRMRITQRHQFTNYSIILFAAILSITGTAFEPRISNLSLPFTSLSSEYLFFILVTPWMFYSLLFMYLSHDYYILNLTIYLENNIGKNVRKIIEHYPDVTNIVNCASLLAWEKHIQDKREKKKINNLSFVSEVLKKYTPFVFPVVIFLIVSYLAIINAQHHKIVIILFWIDAVSIIIISYYIFYFLRKLQKTRYGKL